MRLQRTLGVLGPIGLLVAAIALLVVVERDGPQATQIGGWEAPFGITIVADLLSAIMIVLAGIVGTAAGFHAFATVDARRTAFGYYILTNLLLAGVAGAFLTGDLFNLYVWFEVTLIASFVLLALGGERPQLEGAVKYVALNLVGSTFFLAATGLTYGLTGTLNFADLAVRLPDAEPGLVTAISMLLLVAFGIKAATFPLFFWLPASYHTPPADVTVLFSGLLTKLGVYALLRTFTLLFVEESDVIDTVLLVIAAFTMVTGVLGALAQVEFRRVLSFHIVSQIGYMLLGLGLFTPLAIAGAIYFLAHNIFAKTALFIVAAAIERSEGTSRLARPRWVVPGSAVARRRVRWCRALARRVPAARRLRRQTHAGARRHRGGGVPAGRGLADCRCRHDPLDEQALERGVLEGGATRTRRGHSGRRWRPLARPRAARSGLRARRVWRRARAGRRAGARSLAACGRAAPRSDGLHRGSRRNDHMSGLLWNLLLAGAWTAITGELTAVNLLLGVVIGAVILAATRRAIGVPHYPTKIRQVLTLSLFFVWELLLANFRVARDVLGIRTHIQPAVVALPLEPASDAEITLLAALITLTPGSTSIDVSPDRRTMYVHIVNLEGSNTEDAIREMKEGFERRLLEVTR